MRVVVPARGYGGLRQETAVILIAGTDERWEVFTEDGQALGLVWKGYRTYSPPIHRGSPVARYHRKVPCWRNSARGFFETRREALADLITRAAE